MGGRTRSAADREDREFEKNREKVATSLNETRQMRQTLAEDAKRQRAERERKSKIARGILKANEEEAAPTRSKSMLARTPPNYMDIYRDPQIFPMGKPHGCLFLTLYPGKGDIKAGTIG